MSSSRGVVEIENSGLFTPAREGDGKKNKFVSSTRNAGTQ